MLFGWKGRPHNTLYNWTTPFKIHSCPVRVFKWIFYSNRGSRWFFNGLYVTCYSKRYLKLAPTSVWFTNIRIQSIINTWKRRINSQIWFGYLGIKESNLEACHTITQSIHNSTVLEPLILYLYIALSTVIAYILLYHAPLDLKRLLHAYDWIVLYQTSNM